MKRTEPNNQNPQTIVFPFGTVLLYENYLVSEINEGETVTIEHNLELVKLSESFYSDRPFGYITNRINSYAVDPKTYIETSKIENLVGFAVVAQEELMMSNTQIEKLFLKKPVEVFRNLENATVWIESIIAQLK